jgi:hypothetical protein
MKIEKSFKRAIPGLAAAAALAMGLPVAYAGDAAGAGDFKFALSGYVRGWVSVNLENQGEFRPNVGLHNGVGCGVNDGSGTNSAGNVCTGQYGANSLANGQLSGPGVRLAGFAFGIAFGIAAGRPAGPRGSPGVR